MNKEQILDILYKITEGDFKLDFQEIRQLKKLMEDIKYDKVAKLDVAYEEKIESLEDEVSALEDNIEELNCTIEELQEELEDLQEEYKAMEQELISTKAELYN